jgi:hypothetical protein
MPKLHSVNLSAELRGHHGILVAALSGCAAFAELGNRMGNLPEEVDLPQSSAAGSFGGRPEKVSAEARREFAADCARYAVVGMIGATEVYVGQVAFIVDLGSTTLGQGGLMPATDYLSLAEKKRKHLRHSSSAPLIREIATVLKIPLDEVLGIEWLEALYDLRNCLVHRRGQVSIADLNAPNELRVTWRKIALKVDGTTINSLPFHVDAGQSLSVFVEDTCRNWHVGERVELSADDCQQMAFTLTVFAGHVAEKVQHAFQRLAGVAQHAQGGEAPEGGKQQADPDLP